MGLLFVAWFSLAPGQPLGGVFLFFPSSPHLFPSREREQEREREREREIERKKQRDS